MNFVESSGGAASFGVDPAWVDAAGVNPAGGAWPLHGSLPRRWRASFLPGDLAPLLRIVWNWAVSAIPGDPLPRRRTPL